MKLLNHPVERYCKISQHIDFENDVWDKNDDDTGHSLFYQGVNHIFDRYELP